MMEDKLTDLERLAVRERPDGRPLMHQTWGKLLFMHWRIDAKLLRPLIPEPLEIDRFDGSAWIAVAPFTMWDIRAFPPFIPPIPGLNSAHELNVRTYVHYDRVPGVWFFSLDCNSAAAVLGARTFFHLPYFNADIDLEEAGDTIDYSLTQLTILPRACRHHGMLAKRFHLHIPARSSFSSPNAIASTAKTMANSFARVSTTNHGLCKKLNSTRSSQP